MKKKQSDSNKFYKIIENMSDEQFAIFYFDFVGQEEMFEVIRNVVGVGDKELDKEALELARSIQTIK